MYDSWQGLIMTLCSWQDRFGNTVSSWHGRSGNTVGSWHNRSGNTVLDMTSLAIRIDMTCLAIRFDTTGLAILSVLDMTGLAILSFLDMSALAILSVLYMTGPGYDRWFLTWQGLTLIYQSLVMTVMGLVITIGSWHGMDNNDCLCLAWWHGRFWQWLLLPAMWQ